MEDWIEMEPLQSSNSHSHRIIYMFEPNPLFGLNLIRNQKYSLLTFLPLVLYQQFKFFFNLYFLLIALSQFIKPLKIGFLFTYLGPLGFVLTVTLSKEAIDDYYRFKRDQEANSQRYQVYRNGFVWVTSSELLVGDVVLLERNERVPADCILLSTSDPSGTCFIRTDQLDGETDWKLRVSVQTSQKLSVEDLRRTTSSILVDPPSKDIHEFVGKITWIHPNLTSIDPLSIENTVWMNTVLASGSALGLIVYTGRDTRAIMNNSFPPTKVGLLDLEINRLTKVLAIVTLALSLAMVALDGFRGQWYIYAFRFMILFSFIIPISLRVNLDMGKTLYSWMMMADPEIPCTIVRTSTIPEELGRIDYLLCDKTGTLTKNEMDLKRLHLGTISYGADSMDDVIQHLQSALTPNSSELYFKRGRSVADRVKDIVIALAVCHNVTPVLEDGVMTYQAASPDEIAIVNWTQSVGLTLVHRDMHVIKLQTFGGLMLEYQILEVFPFTSDSKRMGILVRDGNGELTFYQKGADVVMAKIVKYNDWLDEECGNMAREGLRTLVIGRKTLSDDLYLAFKKQSFDVNIGIPKPRLGYWIVN